MIDIQLTDLEKNLIELLGGRRGAANAISRLDLVGLLDGFCERKIRRAIKHLMMEHGIPIASGPSGYYTPVTEEEVQRACKYYHSYAMASLTAESRLRKCSLWEIVEQLRMEFGRQSTIKDGEV